MTYELARTIALAAALGATLVAPALAQTMQPQQSPAPGTMNEKRGEHAERNETQEAGEQRDVKADLRGLFKVEDAAEAIAEGDKAGAAALAAGHTIVTAWPGVRATIAQNGATAAQLSAADRAISAVQADLRQQRDLRRDANEVTGSLAPLFAHAGDPVPSDVHTLDYLGRSITLDVKSGDWARAQRDADTLAARWESLRPIVAQHPNGSAAVTAFDKSQAAVAAAVRTRSATAALAATSDSGAAVDGLEKVFG
ncbi:MAG: hypothetical protein NVS2B17_29550 [Candidatus Velthaea sp.]